MTGNPNAMRQLDVDEAIVIARRQRDELLKACEVLGGICRYRSDDDYSKLPIRNR